MKSGVAVVFWLAVATACYPWIVYPLLLAVRARRRPPVAAAPASWPFLSVIVAAYNEAAWIGAKLASALEDDYPRDRIEVIVVSDESSDGTDRLVAEHGDPRVTLVRQEPRAGKSLALNRGVSRARGEILVFTDANALFARGSLRRLAAPFADERVGLVSGHGLYTASPKSPSPGDDDHDAQAVANGYVRFEAFLRSREAALGVLAGADGAIYALRRSLYRDLGAAEVNDLAHAIECAVAGRTARFDPGAYTIEPPSAHAGQEFRRHVRIVAQNAQLLQDWLPRIVGARRWRLAWALLSHRVLRWLTAPSLTLALGANVVLLGSHPVYAFTLAGQGAFYALALAGLLAERAGWRLGRAALPYYFCVVSAAGLAGLARYLRGGAQAVWAPTGQLARDHRVRERAA
ncbi:MAG TPA: glycosyltransferase [Candidatus Acidoferrum sp.]|nr:glycosyltransferase [Candidatus Acidoferrum sp.]